MAPQLDRYRLKRILLRICSLIVGILCFCASLSCQDRVLMLQSLNQSGGLSNEMNVHFSVDRDGFFWTSSRDGLNRFDGKYVKVFRPSKDGTDLDPNITSAVFQDLRGRKWFSSNSGLHRISPRSDSIWTRQLSPEGNSYHYLFHLEHDSILWVVADQHVYAIDVNSPPDSWRPLHAYDAYAAYAIEDSAGCVRKLVRPLEKQSGFEILSYTNGIYHQIDSIIFRPAKDGGQILVRPFIFIENSESFWVPSSAGLIHLNPDKFPAEQKIYKHCSDKLADGYNEVGVWTDRYLWVSSKADGLLLFDKTERAFVKQDSYFMVNGQFQQLSAFNRGGADDRGNLWLSRFGQGFYFTNLYQQKFDHLLPKELGTDLSGGFPGKLHY